MTNSNPLLLTEGTSMTSSDPNPVDQLAEEFAARHRRGERPSLTEYTDKYPQWADEIRELFPALVLTASEDGTARLWDAATGEPRTAPLVHQGPVRTMFSPDGSRVLTVSVDQTARLWDVKTGLPLGVSLPLRGPVVAAAFRPDGTTLVTGGQDKMVRFWEIPTAVAGTPERLIRWVEVLTGMELSPEGAVTVLDAPAWQERRHSLDQLGGPPVAADAPAERALDWRYRSAVEQVHRGQWSMARTLLDGHQPQDWLALLLRTKVHLQLDQREQAAADLAGAFQRGPRAQVSTWYRIQLAECEAAKQWSMALWYLDHPIAEQPGDWYLHDQRARVQVQLGSWDKAEADYARAQELGADSACFTYWGRTLAEHGQWAKALAAYDRAIALGEPDSWAWVARAQLHMQTGNVAGYRRLCAELLHQFRTDDHPAVIERILWTCALLPDGLADWTPLVQWAEKVLATTPLDQRRLPLVLLGIALYRAGRFDEAVQRLHESTKAKGDLTRALPDTPDLFLAMAYQRLGQTAPARQGLDQAVEGIDRTLALRAKEASQSTWSDELLLRVLRDEAVNLIRGK